MHLHESKTDKVYEHSVGGLQKNVSDMLVTETAIYWCDAHKTPSSASAPVATVNKEICDIHFIFLKYVFGTF